MSLESFQSPIDADAVVVNGEVYYKKSSFLSRVIVRTHSAGVHYGTLRHREGKEVVLVDSRRIYYWAGAASLSELATNGVKLPEDCKFTVRVAEILLTEAIELISCTERAIESIEGVPEWKA